MGNVFIKLLLLCFLLIYGCMTKDDCYGTNVNPSGKTEMVQEVVWSLRIDVNENYEFSHKVLLEKVTFSRSSELYQYLYDNGLNGAGILILSKCFQTLGNDKKRAQVNEIVRRLEKYNFCVVGVRLETSGLDYDRVYRFEELPFLQEG